MYESLSFPGVAPEGGRVGYSPAVREPYPPPHRGKLNNSSGDDIRGGNLNISVCFLKLVNGRTNYLPQMWIIKAEKNFYGKIGGNNIKTNETANWYWCGWASWPKALIIGITFIVWWLCECRILRTIQKRLQTSLCGYVTVITGTFLTLKFNSVVRKGKRKRRLSTRPKMRLKICLLLFT